MNKKLIYAEITTFYFLLWKFKGTLANNELQQNKKKYKATKLQKSLLQFAH
jgi:hypothetical protein